MKKIILFVCVFVFSFFSLSAQKKFNLNAPAQPVVNSYYDKLEFLDSRTNKNTIGEDVADNPPLAIQLQTFMSKAVGVTASDKTLFFQLRDFYIWNGKQDGKNTGFCHMRINLYERDGSDYYFIERLDTLVVAKPKEITSRASDALGWFIVRNLKSDPVGDVPFALNDVKDIDNFEKQDIPLFNTTKFRDGLYYNYFSFANQQPDNVDIQTKVKDGTLKEVKILDPGKNKWQKVSPESVYAVVVDGQPYIVCDGKYWAGYISDNDFLFSVSFKVDSGNGGFSLGIGGGSSSHHRSVGGGVGFTFGSKKKVSQLMKIDHLSGAVLPAE